MTTQLKTNVPRARTENDIYLPEINELRQILHSIARKTPRIDPCSRRSPSR